MGGVLTLAATAAAAVGAVAAYRYIEKRQRQVSDFLRGEKKSGDGAIIDYERDPETGVYRPRD